MSQNLKVLFAGDSEIPGAANYLLGVLQNFVKEAVHIPPGHAIKTSTLKSNFDVFIFSDYSKKDLSSAIEKQIVDQVQNGAGLMMVGGWGSFSGPFGGWRGSEIEKCLPVNCLKNDDRINFSSGAYPMIAHQHETIEKISFKNPPVICGLNDIHPKQESQIVLNARKIVSVGSNVTLDPVEHPLLVMNQNQPWRSAAYASDFAPHWCGGLVDWGTKRIALDVSNKAQIEISDTYQLFVESIVTWLANK